MAARALFTHKFKHEILPTLTLGSIKSLRVIMTRRLSVFIGRAVPGIGWVLLARDVALASHNTVVKFNQLVKPEDRIF